MRYTLPVQVQAALDKKRASGSPSTAIPLARDMLAEAVKQMEDKPEVRALIADALSLMTRQIIFPNPRSPSDPMSKAKVREAKRLIKLYPHETNKEIGARCNIDGGRVCEIRRGERTEAKPRLPGDGLNVDIARAKRRDEE